MSYNKFTATKVVHYRHIAFYTLNKTMIIRANLSNAGKLKRKNNNNYLNSNT